MRYLGGTAPRYFWTEETIFNSANVRWLAYGVADSGYAGFSNWNDPSETVCVTTPTN